MQCIVLVTVIVLVTAVHCLSYCSKLAQCIILFIFMSHLFSVTSKPSEHYWEHQVAFMMSPLVMPLARTEGGGQMFIRNSFQHPRRLTINLPQSYNVSKDHMITSSCISHTLHTLTQWHTGSTELNASVPHRTSLEHFEPNTNDAYGTNTTEIATTGNIAMTTGDTIPATQNVAYEQVTPGTDEYYDYVI